MALAHGLSCNALQVTPIDTCAFPRSRTSTTQTAATLAYDIFILAIQNVLNKNIESKREKTEYKLIRCAAIGQCSLHNL